VKPGFRPILSKLIWATAFSAFYSTAIAQSAFQDLDFEAANIVSISGRPQAVTTANALPGWTVDYGNFQQTEVTYNEQSLGGTTVTVLATGYPSLTTRTPIDGSYDVILFGGLADATISQTGVVPLTARSVIFDEVSESGSFVPEVSIGSDVLSLFPVGSGTGQNGVGFTTWGANVSAWAGQTEQLSITSPANSGQMEFDDISFSPNPVTVTPEPDALMLMGIGGSLFGAYKRFMPKRK
jgi:hypothetical protein